MAGSKRYLATGTLGVTSLLYFGSLPFAGSFAGGLAASTFGAAMIGGLADWFAVSALFRKPLGIPWRTAVIPRNRDRLYAMLVDMVQEELLSKENMKRKIAEHDIAGVVLRYLDEHGGSKAFKRMVHRLMSDVLDKADPQAVGRLLGQFLRQEAASVRVAPLVCSLGTWTVQAGYDQQISRFIAAELAVIVKSAEFGRLLAAFLKTALAHYEAEKNRRKLFNHIAGLSPEKLAGFLQQQLSAWLHKLQQPDHPVHIELRRRLCDYLRRLQTEPQAAQVWEDWKQDWLADADLDGLVQQAVAWLLREAGEHQQVAQWLRAADRFVDQLLADFQASPVQQQRVSDAIRQALLHFIDTHHAKIGALVHERLSLFSNTELVSFIEDKVGEDLQIIRVNGSVIGGLTGSVLYCLTFWL